MTDRPRIVMVDDNAGDLVLVQIAMDCARVPADLITAKDGRELQGELSSMGDAELGLIRLLLVDLNMPVMDGRELLAWVRAQERLRHLPIVILTSSSAAADRRACLAAGATDYWVKPRDFDDYIDLTERFLAHLG
jgi:CheY-like chemotaxis protein